MSAILAYWSRYCSINRYWSRYWYRYCNRQGNRGSCKTAGGRRQDHQAAYCLGCALAEATAIYGFVIAILDNYVLEISRKVGKDYA